eukprot:411261-Prymnesium_polylepis.1
MAVVRPTRRASSSASCARIKRLGSEVFALGQAHEKRFVGAMMSSSVLRLTTSANLSSVIEAFFVGWPDSSGSAFLR